MAKFLIFPCSKLNISLDNMFAHIAIYQWGQEHEQVSNLNVSSETNHVEDCLVSIVEGSVI